jgi:hypothetical protein
MIGDEKVRNGRQKDRWRWGVGPPIGLTSNLDVVTVSRADFWRIPCDIYHTAIEA